MDNTPQVGDIGTIIEVDVGVPADDIIDCKIYVTKPGGNRVVWNATPKSGTTEIYYIVQAGDLDVEGVYFIQSWVKTSNWEGRGEITFMKVEGNI